MFLQRSVVLALAVSAAAASHASFELLMAVDFGLNQVHRYDPVTGISLGSFGQGMMSGAAKIAINESTGVAYVTNLYLDSVQMWNYHTGHYLGDFANSVNDPWGIVRLNNGNIVVANGSSVRTYSTSGGLISSFGSSGYGLGTDGVNLFLGENFQIRKVTASGSVLGTIATPGRDNNDIQIRGNTAYSAAFVGSNRLGRFSPAGMIGYSETTVSNLDPVGNMEAIALSHGAIMYLPGRSTAIGNPTVFSRYHSVSNVAISTFGNLPSTSRITGMAIVLAPEPGTMTAIGLGLVGLLRRRRRVADSKSDTNSG